MTINRLPSDDPTPDHSGDSAPEPKKKRPRRKAKPTPAPAPEPEAPKPRSMSRNAIVSETLSNARETVNALRARCKGASDPESLAVACLMAHVNELMSAAAGIRGLPPCIRDAVVTTYGQLSFVEGQATLIAYGGAYASRLSESG